MATRKVLIKNHLDIHVVEDKDYVKTLERGDGKACKLYLVRVTPIDNPKGQYTIYVLAEDKDRAEGQARCLKGLEEYGLGEKTSNVLAEVVPLPLMVQGWGKNVFE